MPTDDEIVDALVGAFQRGGLIPSPPLPGKEHPLAPAGRKLRKLRQRSRWTVSEIAARTGIRVAIIKAFERGDSAAAGELSRFDLELLAAACCGSLADLLGSEHPWVQAGNFRFTKAVDPNG